MKNVFEICVISGLFCFCLFWITLAQVFFTMCVNQRVSYRVVGGLYFVFETRLNFVAECVPLSDVRKFYVQIQMSAARGA
jgi:hypothetical protein